MNENLENLKAKMNRASTILYCQLILGSIRLFFSAFFGTEGDSILSIYPLPAIGVDFVLMTLGFIAAGKLRQASRGWARYIVFLCVVDLITVVLTSVYLALIVKVAFAYFILQGVRAVFKYHNYIGKAEVAPKAAGLRQVVKMVAVVGGGCIGAFVLLIGMVLCFDTKAVADGRCLPEEFTVELRKQGLLEPGEKIEQFFGSDFFGLEGEYFLLTKRRIILNTEEFGGKPISVSYEAIANLYVQQDEAQAHTFTLVELHDGSEYVFGLPSVDSSDQKFLLPMYEYYDAAVTQVPASSVL